ncbi:MAG TPA: hypothetical protein VG650_08510 [Mycobacteriales bacterium]|nr:hypothetical protein [Mycobacteriales bacterium]
MSEGRKDETSPRPQAALPVMGEGASAVLISSIAGLRSGSDAASYITGQTIAVDGGLSTLG